MAGLQALAEQQPRGRDGGERVEQDERRQRPGQRAAGVGLLPADDRDHGHDDGPPDGDPGQGVHPAALLQAPDADEMSTAPIPAAIPPRPARQSPVRPVPEQGRARDEQDRDDDRDDHRDRRRRRADAPLRRLGGQQEDRQPAGRQRGAEQLQLQRRLPVRIARIPSATTSPTASTGCTTATGATARAATCAPVPSMVAACPSIQRRRFISQPQAEPTGVLLSSAASCCRTAPTANSIAASTASSRPRSGLPERSWPVLVHAPRYAPRGLRDNPPGTAGPGLPTRSPAPAARRADAPAAAHRRRGSGIRAVQEVVSLGRGPRSTMQVDIHGNTTSR